MTPPPYTIPGSSLGAIKATCCSRSSVKLEYGDPSWMLAEQRYLGPAAGTGRSADSMAVLNQLRRVAKAVSSFFF